jgi:chloramphenicol 3-O-phosphotransferase
MTPYIPSPIFILTGPPGAGKSSIARALLQRFPFGFHIPLDDLREWVVSGVAHPVPTWTDETTRQFTLARQGAVQLARQYANAGFAVVIDDIVNLEDVAVHFSSALDGYPFHKVILLPSIAVALQRNRDRTNKTFDTNILDAPIHSIYQWFSEQVIPPDEWLVIDSSKLTIDETVERILSHFHQGTN